MGTIRVATFNVENLLQRFNFHSYGQLSSERALRLLGVGEDTPEYMPLRKSLAIALTDDSRQQTGQAIRDTEADIICLQEVENKAILDDFHQFYLNRTGCAHYGWRRCLEGNDTRGIDVAVMSRQRIKVTSHAEVTFGDLDLFNEELCQYGLSEGESIFRRDCLEVTVMVGAKPLSIFVCHFKSMSGGREQTRCVREAEAEAVRQIITNSFPDPATGDWLIVGDLNDYISEPGHGLGPLFGDGFACNLLERLPEEERWTHYYPGGNAKHQIDYILASPALAAWNPSAVPTVIRGGQPYRVPGLAELSRYPRTGYDRPKASDHCPVAITLEL
ncbi:MAG: endonuclease/exonuclease/phosphatase family protein [Proteobacteria bacterium]|nr:endonuclease/exonuclease/phosphatase family protein [Pseudomonadota bacterium]